MANLLLSVNDIKWNYGLEDVAVAICLQQTARGPILLSTAPSFCCGSVNTDPKVPIKDTESRMVTLVSGYTAPPGQALPSHELWKSFLLWMKLLGVPKSRWLILRTLMPGGWGGRGAGGVPSAGSQGMGMWSRSQRDPGSLGCGSGDLTCQGASCSRPRAVHTVEGAHCCL